MPSSKLTRELHGRLLHRFPALFTDLDASAAVRPALPSLSDRTPSAASKLTLSHDSRAQGTAAGPSSYGATDGAPAPADDGLQKLGADPSKIEPKVRFDPPGRSRPLARSVRAGSFLPC